MNTNESCQRALSFLLDEGADTAIITLGERGAVFATKDCPDAQLVEVDKVKAVDTTGAGDAFVGALAHFLVANPDGQLKEAIRKACKYATVSVQKPGTQNSFIRMEDIPSDFFN